MSPLTTFGLIFFSQRQPHSHIVPVFLAQMEEPVTMMTLQLKEFTAFALNDFMEPSVVWKT